MAVLVQHTDNNNNNQICIAP